jgi:hypothetical protein
MDINDDGEEIGCSNFRDVPDPRMINPLVLALSQAVPKMPALEHMNLLCSLRESTFRIAYYRPDLNADLGCGDSSPEHYNIPEGYDFDVDYDHAHLSSIRLYCQTDDAWRPTENTMKGLRRAGEAKYGGRIYEKIWYRSYNQIVTAEDM